MNEDVAKTLIAKKTTFAIVKDAPFTLQLIMISAKSWPTNTLYTSELSTSGHSYSTKFPRVSKIESRLCLGF